MLITTKSEQLIKNRDKKNPSCAQTLNVNRNIAEKGNTTSHGKNKPNKTTKD